MAEGFKIADGYVDVHAEPDRLSARRAANVLADDVDRVGRRRGQTFFTMMLTPMPGVLSALRTGVPAALATPIGLAAASLGAVFVLGFISAIILGLSTAGIAAAFAVIGAFALKENEKLRAMFTKTAADIVGVFQRAAQPLLMPFIVALGMVAAAIKAAEPQITALFEALAPAIIPVTEGLLGFVRAIGEALVTSMPAFAEILAEIGGMLPLLGAVLGHTLELFAENKDEIIAMMEAVFNLIEVFLLFLAPALLSLGRGFLAIIRGLQAVGTAASTLVGWFRSAWQGLSVIISNPVQIGVALVRGIINRIRGFVSGAISNIRSGFAQIRSILPAPFRDAIDRVIGFFRKLPTRIRNAIGNLGGLLVGAGRAVIQGLINGITSMFGALGNAVSKAVGFITSKLPFSPVKEGPLRSFNQLSTNPGTKLAKMFQHAFVTQMRQFQLPNNMLAMAGAPNVTVNPTVANNPTIRVYLDGRDITPTVHAVIDERNLQLRRAVTSGGMRLP